MNDEHAFFRMIAADPDSDGPRLIFADWLEENGRPEYAEFIRLQCLRAADLDFTAIACIARALQVLSEAPLITHLRALRIGGREITEKGLMDFLAGDWPELRCLSIRYSGVPGDSRLLLRNCNLPDDCRVYFNSQWAGHVVGEVRVRKGIRVYGND